VLKENNGNHSLRWKYEVTAPGTSILPLDPMIIIRGKKQSNKLATVALVSFAVGVAVGYAVASGKF
jgi:hypothetical protein